MAISACITIVDTAIEVGAAVGSAASSVGSAVAGGVSAIAAPLGMTAGELSMTVGLIGVGTNIIGMATGNKIMQEVGMGLAAVGTIGGLSSALVGGETTAAAGDQAASNIAEANPSPTEGLATTTNPAEASAAAAPEPVTPAELPQSSPVESTSSAGGKGIGGLVNTASRNADALTQGANPDVTLVSNTENATLPGSEGIGSTTGAPGSTAEPNSGWGSVRPGVDAAGAAQENIGTGIMKQALASMPKDPSGIAGWWSNLDPSMKAAMAITGGQAASGAAGGIFQGLSASQQLELQKLINSQQYNQMQYLNSNNRYSPRISFTPVASQAMPKGLITSAQGK